MRRLLVALAISGLALGATGYLLLAHSGQPGASRIELAKALLSLGVAVLVGGLVAGLLDRRAASEASKQAKRHAIEAVLQELKAAYELVSVARQRLSAHPTALTFQEAIPSLEDARAKLQHIQRESDVVDEQAQSTTQSMLDYLRHILEEYHFNYASLREAAAREQGSLQRVSRSALLHPRYRYESLEGQQNYSRLTALLSEEAWSSGQFQRGYEIVKGKLRASTALR